MKIDRIEQIISTENIDMTLLKSKEGFRIVLKDNNEAILVTNPGRTLNNNINLGASPRVAEKMNLEIIELLKLKVIGNYKIEYCIDIETPFKLVKNKHLVNMFCRIFKEFNYKRGKLDFSTNENNSIRFFDWKGIKGYKNGKSIKLYSKYEEKKINLDSDKDLLRLEISFGKTTLKQNNIQNISDVGKAREELLDMIIFCEKNYLKKVNRFSKNTKSALKLFKEELLKIAL